MMTLQDFAGKLRLLDCLGFVVSSDGQIIPVTLETYCRMDVEPGSYFHLDHAEALKTSARLRKRARGISIREHGTLGYVRVVLQGGAIRGWIHQDNAYQWVATTALGAAAPFATFLQAARWLLARPRG